MKTAYHYDPRLMIPEGKLESNKFLFPFLFAPVAQSTVRYQEGTPLFVAAEQQKAPRV